MRVAKSGIQIAAENVEKLKQWLDANKHALPAFPCGILNKSAIARSAGLDRQVFVTNPAAKALLAEYGNLPNRPYQSTKQGSEGRELLRQKDSEISRLRELVAKRELELAELRKKAKAAEVLKAMHEMMLETMRHVKPPPSTP
jgi:hypothetical protein